AYSITYNAETYTPSTLERTQIETRGELSKAGIDLSLDIDDALAQRYLAAPVDFVVTLTVFRQTEASTEAIWNGRMSNVKASGKRVTMSFESEFSSLRRPALRRRYQKTCPHPVYRRGCNLDQETFKYDTTVSDIDGLTVSVAGVGSFADGRLKGGMIKGPDNILRFISAHTG